MKSLPFIGIYWILLFLSEDHRVESLKCEMDTRLRNVFFCPTATETFPEWCHCNNSKVVLNEDGNTVKITNTALGYYFSNEEPATAIRCRGSRLGDVCLCPENELNDSETTKCRQCKSEGVSKTLCLTVDDYNHVIANDQNINEPGCNITELCRDECSDFCKAKNPGMETAPPPIRPNMTLTTVKVTTESTKEPEEMDSVFLFGGIGGAVVIFILFSALIICCRKNKNMKKKESPYEAVYSTIDGGSLQNGNAQKFHIYPNQMYDTRVEGPPLPPTRHDIPPHHKSLPALNAGIYIPSGFSESAYQPSFPQKQMSWTNNPTLYRYPSTDDVTGYKSYFQNPQEPPAGPYMYLKRPQVQPTQVPPSGTVDMTPEEMTELLNLSAAGRIGYSEQTPERVKLDDDEYTMLNRDPRSLPVEGNRREHENSRQHATYGFERKNHSSRGTGFKPVPAKRGAYRSKGDVTQTSSSVQTESGNYSSSDSDCEVDRSGGSPYYFKMKVPSEGDNSDTDPVTNNSDYQKLANAASAEYSRPAKKKSSKRKPKPRSRRVRRAPTAEATGEVVPHDEDDVPSDGEYTDDDIEEGLKEIKETLDDGQRTGKVDVDFEDSDYHSPELLSG